MKTRPASLLVVLLVLASGNALSQTTGKTGIIISSPQRGLYNAYLTSVQDIHVETVVGYLPGLPRYLKGVYSNKIKGPDVRVLWPAPVDNSQVLTPGTYTVTGRVAGTDLQPKAIVTVREAEEPATPDRTLEAFRS